MEGRLGGLSWKQDKVSFSLWVFGLMEVNVDVEGAAEQVSGPGESKEAQFSTVDRGGEIGMGRKAGGGGGGGGGTEAGRKRRRVAAVGHFD